MAVKILIQRKIRPEKENEFGKALRELRSKAIHAGIGKWRKSVG